MEIPPRGDIATTGIQTTSWSILSGMREHLWIPPSLALAVVVACAGVSGPTERSTWAEPPETSVELAAGVVVAGDGAALYLMTPAGEVAAVETATGRSLWTSAAAARPLALAAGRLLVQREAPAPAGGLALALLDPATGDAAAPLFEAPLPPGVRPLIEQTLEESFELTARRQDADVLLSWSYRYRPVTGVSPPAGGEPVARHERGILRVDPRAATAVGAPSPAAGEPLPKTVRRALDDNEAARRAWRLADLWAAIEARREPGGARVLSLLRWQAPDWEALPGVRLFEGPAVAHLPSADGRHLMVAAALAEPSGWDRFRWSLFSLETAESAGELSSDRSVGPFLVRGGRLVHLAQPWGRRIDGRWVEAPLRVRAVELASGAEIWWRAVRDPAFRGPRPPGSGG